MSRSGVGGTLEGSRIQATVNKLTPKIQEKGTSIIMELVLPGYARWVETGRKPGKMPPEKPIVAWMKRKGISPAFSFVIRRSIGKLGLNGTQFMQKGFFERDTILEKRIVDLINGVVKSDVITFGAEIGKK
jgi:hypothetical protein